MERAELLPSSMVPSFARGLNILLVDHDTTSLMYLASMLEQYSFKVTTTELASVALSMIRENKDRFKLVMVNIDMSEMSSISFFRILLMKDIPVILLANERNVDVARKALAEGASFFLQKPISLNDLKYVWQHVHWRKWMNQSKETQKGKQEMMNHGYVSQCKRTKDIGNNDNGVRVSAADPNRKSKQIMEVDQFCLLDETQNTCKDQHLNKVGKQTQKQEEKKRQSSNTEPNEELGQNINDNYGISKQKRARRNVWTPELHRKFVAVVNALGEKNARPKLIYEMMNVSEDQLTIRQVANHLQQYKLQVLHPRKNIVIHSPPLSKPISSKAHQPSFAINDYANGGTAIGADHIVLGEYTSGSSSNVPPAKGKSPMYFSYENQEVNNNIAVPKPPAHSAIPASSEYQNLLSYEYAELLKLLDEDEEQVTGLGGELKPADVDQYFEWLTEALMNGGNN